MDFGLNYSLSNDTETKSCDEDDNASGIKIIMANGNVEPGNDENSDDAVLNQSFCYECNDEVSQDMDDFTDSDLNYLANLDEDYSCGDY